MQREQFISLLKSPFPSNDKQLEQVKEIVQEFPYFQTARLLYTKLLKESNDIHYEQQLKITAAYAADRKQLFDLVEKTFSENVLEPIYKVSEPHLEVVKETPVLHEETVEETISEQTEEMKPEIISLEEIIEQRLEQIQLKKVEDQKEEEKIEPVIPEIIPEPVFDIEANYPIEKISEEQKVEDAVKFEPVVESPSKETFHVGAVKEKIAEQESHLEEHKSEAHSFTDWLLYAKPIIPKPQPVSIIKEEAKTPPPKEETEPPMVPPSAIIEKFIKEEPRISPAKPGFFSPVNMARQSVEEHDDLVSPTLAQIYLMQGNIQKSIDTYEKLILLYPEKSAYFASQIEKIKNTRT